MPWVKLDEHFRHHPKILQAGPEGVAMWACGLSYAAQYLTDGVIARAAVPTLLDFGNVDEFAIAEDLVTAGLWEHHPDGYAIHDYLDYNPSKVQVLAERAAKAAAGRAGGLAAAQARAKAESQQSDSRRSTESVAEFKPDTVPVPEALEATHSRNGTVAREDDRADLEAFLLIKRRAPSQRQRELLDRALSYHDVSGPQWAADIMLAHPDDPIGAVIEADKTWRQERIQAAAAAEKPAPRPRRKPSLPESTRELLEHWKNSQPAPKPSEQKKVTR